MEFIRYFHTLRHLKPIQIRYQLWYRIRSKIRFLNELPKYSSKSVESNLLSLNNYIDKSISYSNKQFTFLNQSQQFNNDIIDWDFNLKGKLWCYNLNYMDYLLQPDMSKEKGIELIELFLTQQTSNSVGSEPYPTSLRTINWIKFLSKHKVQKQSIDNSLHIQYQVLYNSLEYHLLGNHLLENGFSLLFGAFYFKDEKLYLKAKQILKNELKEQILVDGGHFELSPMYHQIILDRLLDAINLLQNNQVFDNQDQLLAILTEKVSKMLVWLKNMTFQNGDIPHFNDSTLGIAPSTNQLFNYALNLNTQHSTLNIQPQPQHSTLNLNLNLNLSTSGYRKFKINNYECIVDVGHVGPSYIPGHAHADMLSFVLYADNKPLIIDTGISTYEKNNNRQKERSTYSHNTITVNSQNQSDVWGGFRVGKRAKTKVIKDENSFLVAEHNGYSPAIHKREFHFNAEGLIIEDILSKPIVAEAFLHFHPDRKVELKKKTLLIDNSYIISFKNPNDITLEAFDYPVGYNKYQIAKKCKVTFESYFRVNNANTNKHI